MSHQFTFADSEFSSKRRQTRKEIFLSRMDNLLPWSHLLDVIAPAWSFSLAKREHHAVANLLFECGDYRTDTVLLQLGTTTNNAVTIEGVTIEGVTIEVKITM